MNPEEFEMVAGLYGPVYYQNGDDNAPISGSIPALTFTVERGTHAWRVQNPPEAHTERFVTTRTVVFDASDLIKEYHSRGVVHAYLFRLPSQASPWERLEVKVEDVVIK